MPGRSVADLPERHDGTRRVGLGLASPDWFGNDAGTFGVPAFAIMNLWMVGGSMMIYLAGLQGIPKELHEAAELDGAGAWQRFRRVTLPMLSPVLVFNGVMAVIGSFQVFTQAFVMTRGEPGDLTRFYVLSRLRVGTPWAQAELRARARAGSTSVLLRDGSRGVWWPSCCR